MNYCVTRKELLMCYFKQYLLGREFKVRTDHSALTWLKRMPDPIGQQARSLEVMEEFTFSLQHHTGVRHANADAMSRVPCTCKARGCVCRNVLDTWQSSEGVISEAGVSSRVGAAKHSVAGGNEGGTLVGRDPDGHSADVEHFSVGSWSLEGIQAEQRADPVIGKVIEFFKKDTEKPPWDQVALLSRDFKWLWMQWPQLVIRDGLLKWRFESVDGLSVCWQVVWPASLTVSF